MPIKTIAITTHKGGTGKTVTAMSLGAALVRAQKKCLIVDLDPQGHSSLGLGLEINHKDLTIRDFFIEPPVPIDRVIRRTTTDNLHIIPSNIRLARVAQSLYMRPKREELLKRGMNPVRDHYDFIIIDCPPSLGALTENAIAAADLIIIPCQMEARAADGLVDLLEIINIIKGEEFNDWRILLTKLDSRKSITNQAVMTQLAQWEEKIFKTTIPQSESLNQAQIERTDIFTFEPKSKGALAYESFAQEILNYGN
jgi:chromosome partitioning protein